MKIPTETTKEDIRKRGEIISDFYAKWYATHPTKRIYNIHLKDFINVRFISINETVFHASKSYLSTLAVLQLDAILATAKKQGKPTKAKIGTKNQKDFSHMMQMICVLEGIGIVKLMVGVKKKSKEKVQYCITAIKA